MKKTPKSLPSFTHDVPESDLRTLAQLLYQDILDFYQSEEGKQYRTKLLNGSEQNSQSPADAGLHIKKAGTPCFRVYLPRFLVCLRRKSLQCGALHP